MALDEDASKDDRRAAPAGWYPDPKGSGNLFYWDGTRWTGDVHRAARPGPATPTRQLDGAHVAVIGGGVALAVSPFLGWVKVVLLGDLTLFQLLDATGGSNGLAWAAVVAGAAAATVAFKERNSAAVRGTGLAVGLLGGALALYALLDLREQLREAHGLAAVGIGPYVALGGCLAMTIGALMSKRGS